MTAATTLRAAKAVLALAALAAVPGCGPKAEGDATVDTAFTLPPPRAKRATLTTEEAALMYPDVDHVGRDPFLTTAEQATFDGRVDPAAPPPVQDAGPAPVKVAGRRHGGGGSTEPKAKVILALKAKVKGIIVGKHNTFLFKGKLYEEGDKLPGDEWIVQSIRVTAITFKSVDGQQTQIVKFSAEPTSDDGNNGMFILSPNK